MVLYKFFGDSAINRVLEACNINKTTGERNINSIRASASDNLLVLYASRSGTAKLISEGVASSLSDRSPISLDDFVFDDILSAKRVVIILASDREGLPVPNGVLFFKLLEDLQQDFRVSRDVLSSLQVSVIGVGSIEYGIDNFCIAARTAHRWFMDLGAQCVTEALLITDSEELDPQISICVERIRKGLTSLTSMRSSKYCLTWSESTKNNAVHDSDISSEDDDSDQLSDVDEVALEDAEGCATSEMLTSRQRKKLEKEGYKIIGSHSAVKLCRWTKSGVRGRGKCYKNTFYGIDSSSCMEATPNLSCASKCVFCWRHHKNPVATSWKWAMDPADEIVSEAVRLHSNLIKELRGVPGVNDERFNSAMKIRHCALSLVGEPIMYPQINELITELHNRRISTFLVTNAQFPEAIQNLQPVTQMYVSVDAASPEALKKIDRPLFNDYWERFIKCFEAIKAKKQRTVYRLTLVKEYNMAEDEEVLNEYADLVAIGVPHFIEIKAVTYCGSSDDKEGLTMKNVPWHEEVVKFSQALTATLAKRNIGSYSLACEHKHSCSILIAQNKFNVDGIWHTWIDYAKFADLALSGRTDFSVEEYWAPTPSWAAYGSEERGFDPDQVRHYHRASKVGKAERAARLRETNA